MRQKGTIALKVSGERVEMNLTIPSGPVDPLEMVETARVMTDAIVGAMARKAEREVGPIQCQAGCAACCRQLIPLSRLEATRLAAVVADLPAARRDRLRERFAALVQRLEAAGLATPLRDAAQRGERTLRELGLAFFQLHVDCPFLENGSCSIYAERPLSCREYLVTSPARHCEDPAPDTVQAVPMPARVSNGLIRIGAPDETVAAGFVALPFSLEWAAVHGEPRRQRPGPEMLKELVEGLGKS